MSIVANENVNRLPSIAAGGCVINPFTNALPVRGCVLTFEEGSAAKQPLIKVSYMTSNSSERLISSVVVAGRQVIVRVGTRQTQPGLCVMRRVAGEIKLPPLSRGMLICVYNGEAEMNNLIATYTANGGSMSPKAMMQSPKTAPLACVEMPATAKPASATGRQLVAEIALRMVLLPATVLGGVLPKRAWLSTGLVMAAAGVVASFAGTYASSIAAVLGGWIFFGSGLKLADDALNRERTN